MSGHHDANRSDTQCAHDASDAEIAAALGIELPSRRDVLKRMAVSLALPAALPTLWSCTRQPRETIVPYARSPESSIPGRPRFFATSMAWPTGALGLLVESHMGRPTKIEGNPDHPASLGATDAIAQAQLFGLYDSDRSKVVLHRGRVATRLECFAALDVALAQQRAKEGAGLRLLTETVTSPTLAWQIETFLRAWPRAAWHRYEPVHRDRERAGALLTFGRDLRPLPHFDAAGVVLALDADFLGGGPNSVRATRDFTSRRRVRTGDVGKPVASDRNDVRSVNRLYVVEGSPTLTGAMAEHRLALEPSRIASLAAQLDEELERVLRGDSAESSDSTPHGSSFVSPPETTRWLAAVARDLVHRRGASLIVVGERQPAEVHWFAHHWNHALGNVGRTVDHVPPAEFAPTEHVASLHTLVDEMRAGQVDLLVILGGNPVETAPGDVRFDAALARVATKFHLALYDDETSQQCDWHLPETHFLESWSDERASDGTTGLVQPLIAPLHGGLSRHDLIERLTNLTNLTNLTSSANPANGLRPSAYEIVREFWRAQTHEREPDFDTFWRRSLHDGVVASTQFVPESPTALVPRKFDRGAIPTIPSNVSSPDLELEIRPDPTIHDGRFANHAWLQELPKPLTKLTWENAAWISPNCAREHGLENGDVVEIRGERSLRAPIWTMPGQADGCVTLHLGYGRTRAGRFGDGAGFRAATLQTSEPTSVVALARRRVELARTKERRSLATTQEHDRMEGRDLARATTLRELVLRQSEHESTAKPSMFPPRPRGEHAWAMVIDLSVCTGCSACVVACQAENNIPSVGRDQVERGRALHWIRVDRYFEGDANAPSIRHQPVPCMHCEEAPCELVCPVGATVHGSEGLNEMVYNRCVGTRYCANNCPYKVRHFNFLQYVDPSDELLALQRNPDVTVRTRGVMEKCTYCVQRISAARIAAKRENRPIRDGEVVTACQAVCPAQAIVFGDLVDPTSAVSKLQTQTHRYSLLDELGTRPRTTYLTRVSDPNPELAS